MIKSDHTLWCWGRNTDGQLGNRTTAMPTTAVQSGPDSDWSSVAAGGWHTCALKLDQSLYCWGANEAGEVGNGTNVSYAVPVRIGDPGARWVSVAAGQSHTCAVKADGTLWCWGRADKNQILIPATEHKRCTLIGQSGLQPCVLSPERVGHDVDWASVSAGTLSTCALKRGGSMYCWGAYQDSANDDLTEPARVGTASDWSEAATDQGVGCGIRDMGAIECWRGVAASPRADLRWTAITVGQAHVCGLQRDGSAWCWGRNSGGMLGSEDTADSAMPVRVRGEGSWQAIAAGGGTTCAVATDGAVWCWGVLTQIAVEGANEHRFDCGTPEAPRSCWRAPVDIGITNRP